MRFQLLADFSSRTAAANYEADSDYRHNARQAFISDEIQSLPKMKQVLIAAEELTSAIKLPQQYPNYPACISVQDDGVWILECSICGKEAGDCKHTISSEAA